MANRTVSVALVADVGQYQSAMVRAASSTRAVGTSATTAGTQAQRGFQAAGRGATILTAALAGGVALGLKSVVDASADAEQSVGGVQAVFKNYANGVIASSKEADRALGLSANSYRELATIIGSQMKNAGVPLDQLADKTEGIIGIGADLAAQFGGSTQQAVEALSSAFRGELDPIERYGISLTAAAVGAKAVEMGLSESVDGLSQNAKAMATLAIITEQSADAQGAFGREADTAAGRAQRASASWDNLKVAVGDRLLPAWSALVDVLGTKVIPALGDILDAGGDVVAFIGDLGSWAADNTPLVAALGAVLAIQLAGGLTAVTVAANRMVLTPVVLGLSSLLGAAGSLPAAFSAASGAIAGFMAAALPLLAIGAVVYGITKLVETAQAAGDARKEITAMWDAVDDSRGSAQVEAVGQVVDQLREKIAQARSELEGPRGFWNALLFGPGGEADTSALDEYTEALQRAEAQQRVMESTAGRMAEKFGLTRDQVLELASKYDIDLTSGVSNVTRLMQNFYAQEYGAKPTEATIAVSNAFEDAKVAVDDAKDAVDAFKLSLDILTGAHVSMIAVESAFEAAVASADGALKDLNGSVLNATGGLNMQSESGRAAADVLLDVRDSGNQLIATMIQQGASAEDVRVKDAQLRDSFINTAVQMGISREAALRLADQILGIPAERETRIDADTKAAHDKINAVQGSIDGIRGRTVEVQVRAAGRFIINPQGGLQEFAEGGYTGPGGKYQPAGIVHAGEFVVPQHRVNALGGPDRVGSLVGMPGYAEGGPVVPLGYVHDTRQLERTMDEVATAMRNATPKVVPGGPMSGGVAAMMAALRVPFPGLPLNSGFRPGSITATGNLSYHAQNRAVDVPPRMDVFNWIAANYGGSRELIFSPAGGRQIWNGRPHVYSEPTRGDHWDHVHWAMANGGIIGEPVIGRGLRTGASYSFGERGPETVVPGIRSREFSGGSGGGGRSSAPPNVTVQARVFVGNREITDIARVEAHAVLDGALGEITDTVHYAGG